jgi:ubiquinone/menaquinone biosynthesis C-methylase UbiE
VTGAAEYLTEGVSMSEETKGTDPRLSSFDAEESRIRAAYARREAVVDRHLYSYFNRGNLFVIQERERHILRLLERHGLRPLCEKKILEIGCGAGFWLRAFVQWGATPENLVGIDLLPDRIAVARRTCPSGVTLHCGNAAALPFTDASFDVVLQSTVFSSVLDEGVKQQIAGEMLRVLKGDGAIVWYDFFVNNPRNPDVRGVGKSEIRRLFAGCNATFGRVTLAPPLARRLAPYSWLVCYLLGQLRVLNTHYLALIRRKG